MALSEIERARVHISLPKDSVFLESKQEAKASVVVSLRPRTKLSPQNGAAITYLVASAVDRLSPDAVTVIDSRGSMLVRPRKASAEDVSGASQSAGAPGTASNLPKPPARPSASGSGATRRTENTSYQTSRIVKRTRIPQGAVKRMSLAVLLDQNIHWEGKGATAKRILEPPSPEKIKTLRDLVAAAAGFSETRGAQLTVETLAFESTLGIEPPADSGAPPAPA